MKRYGLPEWFIGAISSLCARFPLFGLRRIVDHVDWSDNPTNYEKSFKSFGKNTIAYVAGNNELDTDGGFTAACCHAYALPCDSNCQHHARYIQTRD